MSVPAATCCYTDFKPADCCTAVCCYPCVYGSALTKYTTDNRKEGLCPDSMPECAVLVGSCVCGTIVPCCVGIYIRGKTNSGSLADNIAAEMCIPCSCASCQMNQYRRAVQLKLDSAL